MTSEIIQFADTILSRLSEYASSGFCTNPIKDQLTIDAKVQSISTLPGLTQGRDHRWREIALLRVETSINSVFLYSVRDGTPGLPCDCIDFLELGGQLEQPGQNSRAPASIPLIIIYLQAGRTKVSGLAQKYVPGNCWQSVTHINWGDSHPFDLQIRKPTEVHDKNLSSKPTTPHGMATPEEASDPPGITRENAPLISIITIVYNGAQFLEQTIQSVINQGYENIEYIIVDGGSTDGTLEIVARYEDYIDRWVSEIDEGIYDALNKGIALARGSLIGAIHSNDLYAAGAVETLVKNALEFPEKSFFHGRITYVDDNRVWLLGKPIKQSWEMVVFGNFYHPSCFVRKSVYEESGAFKLTYPIAADYDLAVRFWKAGVPFHYINQNFSFFRLGGLSSNLYQNQWERHLIRIENGENMIFSIGITILVIANYYRNRMIKSVVGLLRRS